MGFQKVAFNFPEGEETVIEVEPSTAEEMKKVSEVKKEEPKKVEEIEIEVVDDTPKADRNRKPSEPPSEVTDEELEEYSDKVQKRIKHFSKGYHDERREKERAFREKQELENYAKTLIEENKKLKTTVDKNQEVLLEQAKKTAAGEALLAKRAYKQAYDAGDSEKLIEAQEKLTAAKIKTDKLENFRATALQKEEDTVQIPESSTQQEPQVDQRAQKWAEENTWFGPDKAMTGYVMGVHEELISDGVDPTGDEYYEKINSRMRKVFPDQFEDVSEEVVEETKKRTNVVAPATRSTAPKKIRLTQTQVAIAKRLGVPLELYAQKVAEEMRKE
tara:strand:- start:699 stop:1691 length:993 start_codon:yes stop_codon:yes gene_type:complete